ncbi:hypothetical protein AALO_G00177930 [Alosa alosa]|uniref:DUF4604 domain-containing protein n=1 Tax=Alosa alosa TaxID=278164 RepID=A0AAV6G8I7_9TELE|nr:uncharacterized protein KIAA1143 homolog [Alosa sapidissima]XP_048115986.1 uncharacterized protein KIAA1143 homolog [Alosa alosa]KAG5271275.1 hypothetical protein AALO_G00177930 [Alosa alosa]
MSKKGQKGNVSWVKPAEPSFLKKFKSDVGYKEGPTVDTKRQEMPQLDDDSGDSDREDELPQIVVLKKGDLSADEVQHMKKEKGSTKDDEPPSDGKIVFKKPAKRSSSDKFQGISASSSKKKKKKHDDEDEEDKSESKSGAKVKNKSLLSFGGDEEDDDD